MSSLTSWNMSIPEKGGGRAVAGSTPLNLTCVGISLVQLWMVFFGIFLEFFSLFFFVFLFFTNLTPEVKKIVFCCCCCCCRRRLHKVLSFFSPLFLLQNEKTRNHEK